MALNLIIMRIRDKWNKSFLTFLCLILTSMVTLSGIAQSDEGEEAEGLILNGSFEETGKIKKLGQFYNVTDWFVPTKPKADVFSPIAELADVQPPLNVKGKCNPSDGENYAGLNFFSYQGKLNRTYISTELTDHLEKGSRYCLKYDVSLAEVSKYAVNNIGAHFSKKKIEIDDKVDLIKKDRVVSYDNRVFEEMGTWEGVCIPFTSTGFEKFVTIGNFAPSREIEYKKLDKPSWIDLPQEQIAYYFIDNIQLFQIDRDSECDCKREEEKIPNVIFSKSAVFNERASIENKLSYSTVHFFMVKSNLTGAAKRDLDRVVEILKENPQINLSIEGHSDDKEVDLAKLNDNYLNISEQRCEAVKEYLIDNGIDSSRLTTVAHNNNQPLTTLKTPLSLAKNRRVEFRMK